MRSHISLEQADRVVLSREDLARNHWTDRAITAGLADGTLRRLQRGRYVMGAEWHVLWPESRHLLEVTASFAEMRNGDAVASHESAAVVWGLPLYRHVPTAVHVTIPGGKHVSSRAGLRRHSDALPEADVTSRGGHRTTTLDRTAFDLARSLPVEAAVAAVDAALRQVALIARTYDLGAAEEWRDRMLRRIARSKGMRGVRQAAEVVAFADGRAESPTESVARLQLARLGFGRVGLQIPVRNPTGGTWWVDLELEDVGTFLEIDGAGKYEDEALRSGRTLEQVLLDEKRREDWIRGTTQKRFARAETKHVSTADSLALRLSAFGIHPPRG
jgi:hypothetical protein